MTTSTATPGHPREGVMATMRDRRALITRVRPNGSPELHAVDVDYTDVDGRPQECFAMGGEPVVDDVDGHSVDARVAIHSFRCGITFAWTATRSISAAVPDVVGCYGLC